MAEQNATVPMDKRIEFQIGINVGDIVVADGDIYSDCELRISQLTIPAKSGISTIFANAEKFMAIKHQQLDSFDEGASGNDNRRPDRTGRIGRRAS